MGKTNFDWRFMCAICKKTREDKDISVVSVERTFRDQDGNPLGGMITVNVKYCNDKKRCEEKAKKMVYDDADRLSSLKIERTK